MHTVHSILIWITMHLWIFLSTDNVLTFLHYATGGVNQWSYLVELKI